MEKKQRHLKDAIAQQEDIQKNLEQLKVRSDGARDQLDDIAGVDGSLRIEDHIEDIKV